MKSEIVAAFSVDGITEFLEKAGREQQEQAGRQIDRKVIPPLAHRASGRAIESPARTVDAEAQRIDPVSQAAAGRARRHLARHARLDQSGNGEQHCDQTERKQRREAKAHERNPGFLSMSWP
jgi:hypothetical protein